MTATDGCDANPVVLITGANRGLGYATAERLLRRGGSTVVISARSSEKGCAAAARLHESTGTKPYFVMLDILSPKSIDEAAKELDGVYGRLDVLVNNGGILLEYGEEAKKRTDPMVAKDTLDTNLWGTLMVIEIMRPILEKSKSGGRVVNVASGAGARTLGVLDEEDLQRLDAKDFRKVEIREVLDGIIDKLRDPSSSLHGRIMTFGYGLSKGALLLFTRKLAQDDENMAVFACTPGLTGTEMLADYSGPRTPSKPEDAAKIVEMCALDVPASRSGEFLRLRDGKLSSEPLILRPEVAKGKTTVVPRISGVIKLSLGDE